MSRRSKPFPKTQTLRPLNVLLIFDPLLSPCVLPEFLSVLVHTNKKAKRSEQLMEMILKKATNKIFDYVRIIGASTIVYTLIQ